MLRLECTVAWLSSIDKLVSYSLVLAKEHDLENDVVQMRSSLDVRQPCPGSVPPHGLLTRMTYAVHTYDAETSFGCVGCSEERLSAVNPRLAEGFRIDPCSSNGDVQESSFHGREHTESHMH